MRRYPTRWRRPLLLATVLATALYFGPTVIASAVAGPPQVAPTGTRQLEQLSGDAFDRAFLIQMTMHHAMGVMMTRPVVAFGAHQELKDLGFRMVADQSAEIVQMRGWMQAWYGQDVTCPMLSDQPGQQPGPGRMRPGGLAPGGPIGGMMPGPGMPMTPGAMPGMMPGGPMGAMPGMPMMGTPMIGGLGSLPPDQLDATFMTWMIEHHQGAIDMASLAEDRAAHQEVKNLAASIIASQSGEIGTMQEWLAAWYGR